MSSKLSFLKAHGLSLSRRSSLSNPPRASMSRASTRSQNSRSFELDAQEMRRVFERYDTNKDGRISKEEYKAMLRAINGGGPIPPTEAEASRAFQVADRDGDGFIDFQEFMGLHNNKVRVRDIEGAFRVFDCDGDGKISAAELMEVMRRMGDRFSLESCKRMIREVDHDGDGLIDLDEFTTMMTRTMKLAN